MFCRAQRFTFYTLYFEVGGKMYRLVASTIF